MKIKQVVTIGLGYIGLPTSALISSKGINVFGVDVNPNVVETINKGKIHIVEPDLEKVVYDVVTKGLLKAGTKPIESEVYLIVVPTPFKGNFEPDISYVQSAIISILDFIKPNDLIIIESTSPIGTTEEMQNLILDSKPELKDKFFMAYCPERVLPGNIMYELIHNDRVIGGIDEMSTKKALQFYAQFVEGELHPTNAKTAEMVKLTENSSRDVQIAFANELSIICERAGIDVWELIRLANKHPRVNILQPGCGVGGHCIAVDPYFITSAFPNESRLIAKAREINNYKTQWCIEKVKNEALKFEIHHKRKPSVAIMGLAFKPNIDDLRESPALQIAMSLKNDLLDYILYFVEPNLSSYQHIPLTDYKIAITEADIIVFLVAHKDFKGIRFENKMVLDCCGVLNN